MRPFPVRGIMLKSGFMSLRWSRRKRQAGLGELFSAFRAMGDVEPGESQDFFCSSFFRLVFGRFRWRLLTERFSDESQCLFFIGVRQKAVESDFHEAGRQDVQQEAADELAGLKDDGIGFVFFAVAGGEGDLAVSDVFDPVVVDGDAMGVAP